MKLFTKICLISTACAIAFSAHAGSNRELDSKIRKLQNRVNKMERKLQNAANNQIVSLPSGPKFSNQDGSTKFAISGQIQADMTFFKGDSARHANNTNFRRARIAISGVQYKDWKYKFEYDFAGSGKITEAFLEHKTKYKFSSL